MNEAIRNLEPKTLWNHFADLNAIPRASKKEERVIAFMEAFGASLGLPTTKDAIGNVIIKKPATVGMENRATLVLQGHLDMVHQKNSDTDFNFDSQGIEMGVDGDWVKAKGTTLGADNGIGVAAIMTLLSSQDIPHPALEALFTIDEETGMTGALGLKGGLLDGRILLNMDTEEDTELTIGCAGGIDVTAAGKYPTDHAQGIGYLIQISGLTGGHSGMDIIKNRANANKIMNQVLLSAAKSCSMRIHSIDGGSLRNAIPRESKAEVWVPVENAVAFEALVAQIQTQAATMFKNTDPGLKITAQQAEIGHTALDLHFQKMLLQSLDACHNGVYTMSKAIEGLVQTSNNVARVLVANGECSIQCLTRSSVDTEKMELAMKLENVLESCGLSVGFAGSYPGWTPNANSAIVKLMRDLYIQRFGSEPNVNACHAGLECGILGTNYPGMEMISFGPNIHGAHSPDEKVQISSVQKFWGFVLATLEATPERLAS